MVELVEQVLVGTSALIAYCMCLHSLACSLVQRFQISFYAYVVATDHTLESDLFKVFLSVLFHHMGSHQKAEEVTNKQMETIHTLGWYSLNTKIVLHILYIWSTFRIFVQAHVINNQLTW